MNCSVPIDVVVKGWNAIEVVFDAPKNAVLVGTTAGFQLVAVLKVFEPGLSSQVASWARAGMAASNAAAAAVVSKCARIAFTTTSIGTLQFNANRAASPCGTPEHTDLALPAVLEVATETPPQVARTCL